MSTSPPPARRSSDRRAIGLAPGAPPEAAGQDARKYGTANPVVRWLLDRWTRKLRDVIGSATGTVVDVGVGEGLALQRVLAGREAPHVAVGVEYRHDKVSIARGPLPGLAGVVADAGMVPLPEGSADLVLCIEVLEHLTRWEPAVEELARVARDRCVVSVPWEPWFRLGNLGRGKNLRHLGNDPEHVGFFTPRRLERALGASFADVRIHRSFPWLIAECRAGRPGPGPRAARK